MKYFRDPVTLGIFAYEEDGSQDDFIDPSFVQLTDEEVYLLLNPPPPVLSAEDICRLRQAAYSDPYTGSDRFFCEHMRHHSSGNEGKAEEAKNAGLLRVSEIQEQYPWPK